MKGKNGFTLIEVLITVGILGTLLAIAVLSSQDMMDGYRASGAARQIFSDMQMTRLRAIREGKNFSVSFTESTATYTISAGAPIKSVSLANDYTGIKMCNSSSFTFNANGTAGGSVTVSKGAKVQRVYISSTGTGTIKIQRLASSLACP